MPDPTTPPNEIRPARRGSSIAPLVLLALVWLGGGCGGDIEARMAEVRALQDVGQFSASIEELREILAIVPDYPEAAYRLGVALVQTGESSRAVWALQKASESPAYAVVAGLLLASTHLDNENFEEAVRAADRVLEIDPERQLALQLRAKGNIGAGRYEEALVDTRRLIELYPDDYTAQVTHAAALAEADRLDEAREAFDRVKEMGAASGDPAIGPRACLAPALFAFDELDDRQAAELLYEDCVARYPSDSVVIDRALLFFDGIGKRERATRMIRAAVEAEPESLPLRSTLANRLSDEGNDEQAEKVLIETAESFGSAAAWNLLASFYRKEGDPRKALAALEKVMDLAGGGGDQMRFTQADVLVDLGELERAEEVANSLSEPTYAALIRGRVLMERGDARGALAAFDQGIRNWPNNAGARYLAGLAAHQLGDHERAVTELREAVRADVTATRAALLLARIHLERKEYGPAAAMAAEALKGPGGRSEPQTYVIGARALTGLGRYDRARDSVDSLLKVTGDLATASVERAAIEKAASGPEAAILAIRQSGVDAAAPGHAHVLRALADYQLQVGRGKEALALVEEAVRRSPESADAHEVRGSVQARAGRVAEARASFERAIELDGKNAAAVGGLATLVANEGDAAGAIELFDRAAALAPGETAYTYAAAQLALASGSPTARERLEAVVGAAPGHAGARNDLAWLLADRGGDLDRALELAEEARSLDESAEMLDTLGWVYLKRSEAQKAVGVFEEALAADPGSPTLQYHLAMALKAAGDEERARDVVKQALQTPQDEFPDREAAGLLLAELERP